VTPEEAENFYEDDEDPASVFAKFDGDEEPPQDITCSGGLKIDLGAGNGVKGDEEK
jgi:hypothetical protein